MHFGCHRCDTTESRVYSQPHSSGGRKCTRGAGGQQREEGQISRGRPRDMGMTPLGCPKLLRSFDFALLLILGTITEETLLRSYWQPWGSSNLPCPCPSVVKIRAAAQFIWSQRLPLRAGDTSLQNKTDILCVLLPRPVPLASTPRPSFSTHTTNLCEPHRAPTKPEHCAPVLPTVGSSRQLERVCLRWATASAVCTWRNLQICLDGRFAMEAGATTSSGAHVLLSSSRGNTLQIYHDRSLEWSSTGFYTTPKTYVWLWDCQFFLLK